MGKVNKLISLDDNSLNEFRWKMNFLFKESNIALKFMALASMNFNAFINSKMNRERFVNRVAKQIIKGITFKDSYNGCMYTNCDSYEECMYMNCDGPTFEYELYQFGNSSFEFCAAAFIDEEICDTIYESIHEFEDKNFGAMVNYSYGENRYNDSDTLEDILNSTTDEEDKESLRRFFYEGIHNRYSNEVEACCICSNSLDKYIDDVYDIKDDITLIQIKDSLTMSIILDYLKNIKSHKDNPLKSNPFFPDSYKHSYIRASYNPRFKYELMFVYTGGSGIDLLPSSNPNCVDEIINILNNIEATTNFITNTF